MLKISYADCLRISPAISAKFNLEVCVGAQNREKFTTVIYFERSRSLKVIGVDMFNTIVASGCIMICSMSNVYAYLLTVFTICELIVIEVK